MGVNQRKSEIDTGIIQEQIKDHRLWILVFFLLLLVSITSCLIGYMLSSASNNGKYTGQIVDTIFICSGDAATERAYQVNISGTISYSDGTPYANGLVELRSEVRQTTTDELGRFKLESVPEGTHTLSIIENGQAVLSRTVTIEKSSLIKGADVTRNENGCYLIHVPIDIVQIDLLLELDDENLTLVLDGSHSQTQYYPGTANSSIEPPLGHQVTPDTTNPPAVTGLNKPLPPVAPAPPVAPLAPIEPVPPVVPLAPVAPMPPVAPVPPATPVPPVVPPAPTEPGTPGPGSPSNPKAGLTVSDGAEASRAWTKVTAIDIFAEREGNSGVRTINGKNVIAPGSKGRYIFRVNNNETLTAVYSIALSETDQNSPELPMRYRIKQGLSGNHYIGGNDWKEAEALLVTNAELAAGADMYYTLEWQWDSLDGSTNTAIGMQEGNPVYILEISIRANTK